MEEAKAYLERVYRLEREVNLTLQKASMLRQSLYGRGVQWEGRGGSGVCHDALGNAIGRVLDYEQVADEKIDALIAHRLSVEKTLSLLPDRNMAELLERRYLLYQKWGVIAREMGYSERRLFQMHTQGLLCVQQILVFHKRFQ